MRERRGFESGCGGCACRSTGRATWCGCREPGLDDAVKQALRDKLKLIGLSPQDAYTLSSKPGP
jgi:hypothetical protein